MPFIPFQIDTRSWFSLAIKYPLCSAATYAVKYFDSISLIVPSLSFF